MEVRYWYLGLSIDFDYGWHILGGDGASEVSSTNMHVTSVLKAYYPLKSLEVFLGFGLGYSSMAVTEDSTGSEASWSTFWQGTKTTGGVWLDLEPFGMPAGFSLDISADLMLNFGGSRCTKYGGAGPCLEVKELKAEQRDVANHLRVGSALRYTF